MQLRRLIFAALVAVTMFSGRDKPAIVFDMHYGPLLGVGWTVNDPGGVVTSTVTADVKAGSYVIPVEDGAGLNPGILAAYQADNGEWWTFRVRASSAHEIASDRPLEAIQRGAKIGNVYKNDAHPNLYGGAAIVDAFFRKMSDPVFAFVARLESWRGPGVSYEPVANYDFLGATVIDSASVSWTLPEGDYVARVPLSTGAGKHVRLTVEGGASVTFEGVHATYLAEIPLSGGAVRIRAEGDRFSLGRVEIVRVVAPPIDIHKGKVVLLADSWGTADLPASPIVQSLRVRLSSFVGKGVSGQRSDQLLSRFDTDVTTEHPDTVIVITGTNDFYQGVTPQAFMKNIEALKEKIRAIGAQPIIFTPSVGAITYSPPQFFPSRAYRDSVGYLDTVR